MSERFDLLFKNGLLITGSGIQRADLGVRGEKITAIAPDLPVENARRVIDARGKYIFPGTIDVHVHPVYEDNVEDCSRIAAYGGTTSVLHFAYAKQGDSLLQKVTEMIEDGQAHSLLDFGVHGGIWEAAVQVPEIVETMKLGVTTFKFFMTYLKQGWYTDDYQLIKAMDILAEHGGMAMVHAENGGGIDYLEDKYLKGPNAHARYFNTSRPAAFEEEAIFRAARLAEVFKTPLYIPHVTAARAVRAIRLAMEDGLRIFGETCPQYLTLTQKIIDERARWPRSTRPSAPRKTRTPSGRASRTASSTWLPRTMPPRRRTSTALPDAGLRLAPGRDADAHHLRCGHQHRPAEPGAPGPGAVREPGPHLRPVPAQGHAAGVGSDADIVVYDPCREYTITAENQHSKVGYTLYENRKVLGWPEMSFQRGRPVLENGEIVAEPGCGQFMPTTGERLDPVVV